MARKDENKKICGICRVGEKGQIVIPKEAREMFNINPGDTLVVLGDKRKGMAIVKSNIIEAFADNILSQNEDGEK